MLVSKVYCTLAQIRSVGGCDIKQPTVVQKDFERIIRMIGTPAQPPKPRKNAPGRQLGDTQVKRIRHPVVKKHKNTAVTEKMIA